MKASVIRSLILILLVSGIGVAAIYRDHFTIAQLELVMDEAGMIAPLIFMGIYAIGTVLFLPGSVMTLLGGALFGPVWGTFYNLVGATFGSMLSFLVARYIASDWVTKKSAGKMKQLINGVETEGWRFVAFTRLVPLFPFNLLNYALGLTRISFSQYSITSGICMLPGAAAYTYLGYIGREAALGGEDLMKKVLMGLALFVVVLYLPRLIKNLRKGQMLGIVALKEHLDSNYDVLLLDVRTEDDYVGKQGHISGSTLIPLEQLEQRIDELDGYQNKPIITICRSDIKSAKAAHLLIGKGFTDVVVVRNGMNDWIKQGYTVEH